MTSGRETGGAVQVAPTGPFLPGFAAAPHAINPTGSSTITARVVGFFPAGTPITFRRNGVSIATATSDANGGGIFLLNVPAGADGSAVFSVDSGRRAVGGNYASRNEVMPVRHQWGTRIPPSFRDRDVIDSAVGGIVALVGEGFMPTNGDPHLLADHPAARSGASAIFFGTPSGQLPCTLTDGRQEWLGLHRWRSLGHELPGMIVAPSFITLAVL